MFISRLNMTGGQIVPQFAGYDNLPTYLNYTPSGYEWIVALAGIGFTGVAFLPGRAVFRQEFHRTRSALKKKHAGESDTGQRHDPFVSRRTTTGRTNCRA